MRYGNKSVISDIRDDEDMPYIKMKDGSIKRVKLLLNMLAIINRTTSEAMVEMFINGCSRQVIEEMKSLKTFAQRENLLLRKGVKNDDIDYVMFKVSKQKGEFEDNLEQFLTDNPKYLSSYEEQHKTVDFGVEHTEKEVDGYEQARRIMGLK